jgi:asparagine synthase (glutamine-hydrolysing)
MCGIAGIFGNHDVKCASKMINALSHRGPNDKGLWSDKMHNISLGHVRLSIIDTSNAGRQPMSYQNERYWIIFNGEIYNFNEIKLELINLGYFFNTNTDTEVILVAFSVWGNEFVKRLRGMFAFAIYDKYAEEHSGKLYLFRDRLGIKPLMYMHKNDSLYFASELSSFLALDSINLKINYESIVHYLSFGSIPQPDTIFNDISYLPAGHYIEFTNNNSKLVKYWDLHDHTTLLRNELKNISYDDAVEQIRILLNNSIKYSLVSDVEIGVFLSGGVDSTAILALMYEQHKKSILTYNIGFNDNFNKIDESKYAILASNHFKSKHKCLSCNHEFTTDLFTKIISSLDQPSSDGTNTWLVSNMASKDVKVALSGLGGDEIFAGYNHFHKIYSNFRKPFYGNKLLTKIIQWLNSIRPNFITLNLFARFFNPILYLYNQRRVFYNFQLKKVLRLNSLDFHLKNIFKKFNNYKLDNADIIQQISYIEIMTYMQSVLLRDSDIMSMSNGLEIRPVLLDHELVEYVYSLPQSIKINDKVNKKLFIDAINDIFPNELKNRKKMGFELPFDSWISGPLNNTFLNLFDTKNASFLFKNNFLNKHKKLILKNKPTHVTWTVGVLLAWLQHKNIILEN